MSIIIGDDVEVTALAVNGNHVKIGIDAPEDVDILREEYFTGKEKMRLPMAMGSAQQVLFCGVVIHV